MKCFTSEFRFVAHLETPSEKAAASANADTWPALARFPCIVINKPSPPFVSLPPKKFPKVPYHAYHHDNNASHATSDASPPGTVHRSGMKFLQSVGWPMVSLGIFFTCWGGIHFNLPQPDFFFATIFGCHSHRPPRFAACLAKKYWHTAWPS